MPRPIPKTAYCAKPSQHPRFFAKIQHIESPYQEAPVEPIEDNLNTRFTNLCHIYRLIELKSDRGSDEYLSYYQSLSQFTISHYFAWKKLLLDQNISVAEALTTMKDLSEHQANAIARGFSHERVLDEAFVQSLFQRL